MAMPARSIGVSTGTSGISSPSMRPVSEPSSQLTPRSVPPGGARSRPPHIRSPGPRSTGTSAKPPCAPAADDVRVRGRLAGEELQDQQLQPVPPAAGVEDVTATMVSNAPPRRVDARVHSANGTRFRSCPILATAGSSSRSAQRLHGGRVQGPGRLRASPWSSPSKREGEGGACPSGRYHASPGFDRQGHPHQLGPQRVRLGRLERQARPAPRFRMAVHQIRPARPGRPRYVVRAFPFRLGLRRGHRLAALLGLGGEALRPAAELQVDEEIPQLDGVGLVDPPRIPGRARCPVRSGWSRAASRAGPAPCSPPATSGRAGGPTSSMREPASPPASRTPPGASRPSSARCRGAPGTLSELSPTRAR